MFSPRTLVTSLKNHSVSWSFFELVTVSKLSDNFPILFRRNNKDISGSGHMKKLLLTW